jgi:hypothetical protein
MGIVAYDKNLELLGNRLTAIPGKKDENFNRVWSLAQQSGNGQSGLDANLEG